MEGLNIDDKRFGTVTVHDDFVSDLTIMGALTSVSHNNTDIAYIIPTERVMKRISKDKVMETGVVKIDILWTKAKAHWPLTARKYCPVLRSTASGKKEVNIFCEDLFNPAQWLINPCRFPMVDYHTINEKDYPTLLGLSNDMDKWIANNL